MIYNVHICAGYYADSSSLEKILLLLRVPVWGGAWGIRSRFTQKDNLFDRYRRRAEMYFPYGFDLMGLRQIYKQAKYQYAVEADVL